MFVSQTTDIFGDWGYILYLLIGGTVRASTLILEETVVTTVRSKFCGYDLITNERDLWCLPLKDYLFEFVESPRDAHNPHIV
jgi:hypothetical protein